MPQGRKWIYIVALSAVAAAAMYFAVGSIFGGKLDFQAENVTHATTSPQIGSLTIVTFLDGSLAGGAAYRISPDPFTGGGNFTIHDGDSGRDESSVDGIITISGIPDGTFSVIQVAGPEGQQRDIIPRVRTVSNSSSEAVTFGANPANSSQQDDAGSNALEDIESITYAAKFECGTIRGAEGPLRPGHYDTDIGIFNKQGFPVRVAWSAASSDNEATSNALLKTLGAETSTSIVCKDIRTVIGEEEAFAEGFVIIEVPVDPMLLSSFSGANTLRDSSSERIDVLDVQIFYTANALEELPHPVLVDKISFVIASNATVSKLPESMVGRVLDVTLPSEVGKISDPVERVKTHLAQSYNMTAAELSGIIIEVRSVDVGVGTMIDDHAISLSKVQPKAKTG